MGNEVPKIAVLHEAHKELLLKTEKQFRIAEEHIKAATLIYDNKGGLNMPAVNELRYAGEHLLSGLTANTEAQQGSEFKQALNHCRRASYDAVEISCVSIIENINAFYIAIEDMIATNDIPDYAQKKARVREIKEFLVSHSREDADQYWETVAGYAKELDDLHRLFAEARPEIIKRHTETVQREQARLQREQEQLQRDQERLQRERIRDFWQRTGVIIAAVGSLLFIYVNFIKEPAIPEAAAAQPASRAAVAAP